MMIKSASYKGNTVAPVPSCATPAPWPPPWLAGNPADSAPSEAAAAPLHASGPPPPTNDSPRPDVTPAAATAPARPAGEPQGAPGQAYTREGPAWEGTPGEPLPCPQCGSLELWQDFRGDWHCQHCEAVAFRRALTLVDLAGRLRRAASRRR